MLESPNSEGENAALIVFTSAALLTLLPVAAHQLGILPHLPDPPGKMFESDAITESAMAHPLEIPDGLLGIGSYTATLALALSARSCSQACRLLPLKLAADGALAGFNTVRQALKFRKLCSWCIGTAVCTAAMLFVYYWTPKR
jgi:uncharacterized membrane protein